jgi:hypothetical protein
MALVPLDTIKEWLNITNNDHDVTLTLIRDAMEAAVINYCETSFALEVVTHEILDGNRSDVIVPRFYPIVSVQGVYLHVETDGTGGTQLETTDYRVADDAIVLSRLKTPFARSRVRVDYTWGYDGLPSDVELAIVQAVEAEFRRKGRKSIGTNSRSKKSESEGFANDVSSWDAKSGLPKEIAYKLQPYKSSFEFPTQPMAQRNQ